MNEASAVKAGKPIEIGRVLFIYEHNSARSQVNKAFLKRMTYG